ncbi:MAG: cytochrome P450 [Chloroflexales bacterium]|nr:cytochrome P450 [Chloroflexales bacterium]
MLNAFRRRQSTQSQPIAPGPCNNLFQQIFAVRRDPLGVLLDAQHRYGDVVRFEALGYVSHLLCHPDAIRHVLQENSRNYPKSVSYDLMKPMMGEGLLTSDGDFWRRQRRLSQPAFHRQRIGAFAAIMTRITEDMLDRWQPVAARGQWLDVSAEMTRLTLSIVSKTLFNTDVGVESNIVGKAITVAFKEFDRRLAALFALPDFVPTPSRRRLKKAIQTLDHVVYRIIEERRRSGEDIGDLLSMLVFARDEETGESMNDKQLRDEVMAIFLAGHETTANALNWIWYLLSKHPTVERRLHNELATVLGGRPPTLEDLPKLSYTTMVIEESLRLYPPAWVIERRSIAADQIGPYAIPPGSTIILSQYITHRHPACWENPESFDPERFTPERVAARPRFAYFPFGGGPRICIGNNFAMMELQLVLATIAQRYRLALVPGHPIEPEPMITLRPRYGILMDLVPRTEAETLRD